jgi:crotonobetainyl-CoA:carnitine CoA-transferase CaiB-like acyl-CoA transferase
MAQGMGGIMDLTGMAGGDPTRVGIPISDIFTGVYSVVGILAALAERERTGKGAHVDTALVDSTVAVLSNQGLNYLVSGKVPKRIGNAHANIVPYQVFPVADGHVIIATGNDNQYVKLCHALGAPELAQDPAYRDNVGRLKHRDALIAKLSALTARLPRNQLLDKLARRRCQPDQQSRQVFNDAGAPPRHEC